MAGSNGRWSSVFTLHHLNAFIILCNMPAQYYPRSTLWKRILGHLSSKRGFTGGTDVVSSPGKIANTVLSGLEGSSYNVVVLIIQTGRLLVIHR